MSKSMNTFYKRIESEYKVKDDSWDLLSAFKDLSDVDRVLFRYEFLSLNNFEANIFNQEIEGAKEQITNYLLRRIPKTKNPHLLARYNHFLLYMTRNNNYASKAVEYYQKVLSYYLSTRNQGFHILYFSEILAEIISLSTKHKINVNVLKNQIDSYLKDLSLSSQIKTLILEIISKNEYKLFKSAELSSYPQLCIGIAAKEDDTNMKKRLLEIAVHLAKKTSNKELGKIANEMLGDLEYSHILPLDKNNIAISHLNENHYIKIIDYYRQSGQKEKVTKAIREFEENKKYHSYIKIQSKVPIENAQQVYDVINKYLEQLLENTPEIFILQLCFNKGLLLFPPIEEVKNAVEKQMNQSEAHKYFSSKLYDFNNNTTTVSHEKLGEHQIYYIFLQNHIIPLLVELLKRAIDKKKMGYFQIKKTLEKTAFGFNFNVNIGDSEISYTWFSLIDIGIREFFKQFHKVLDMKQSDWRFTIDFLTPKFEAIFREIVAIAGGNITKVKENGDSELKPLEDLFASSEVKKIFNEDDLFLFRDTFTKVGRNIRNNVAHGLYKPFDYTFQNAILVFLCILRLNKVSIYINSKSKS